MKNILDAALALSWLPFGMCRCRRCTVVDNKVFGADGSDCSIAHECNAQGARHGIHGRVIQRRGRIDRARGQNLQQSLNRHHLQTQQDEFGG